MHILQMLGYHIEQFPSIYNGNLRKKELHLTQHYTFITLHSWVIVTFTFLESLILKL